MYIYVVLLHDRRVQIKELFQLWLVLIEFERIISYFSFFFFVISFIFDVNTNGVILSFVDVISFVL